MSQGFDHTEGDAGLRSLTQAEQIPVDGESLTAFVGPAPRGPVDHAVSVNDVETFDKVFGLPDYHCRMGLAIRQFFANGGRSAVVVRVSSNREHNIITLPAGDSALVLEARNPGPLEFLRASIDYDSIPSDEERRFNIVIQRLRAPDSAWIDEQEYFRNVTVNPESRDYIGKVLSQSPHVRVIGKPPAKRPDLTIRPGSVKESGYVAALTGLTRSPAPTDYDLIGCSESGTGLAALETVQDIAHVCLISGAPQAALGPVAMFAADSFCRTRQALLVVDPPERWQTAEDAIADQRRSEFASPNVLTWFPCVQLRSASGDRSPASATGAVAAALAERQRNRGVEHLYDEPYTMLRGGLRLATEVSADDSKRLARVGISTLARRSALHVQLRGNVTQSRHANLIGGGDDLMLRSEALFILRRIRLGTRWVTGNESTPRLWRELHEQLAEFMTALHEAGLLAGAGGEESWFVRCDHDTNRGLVPRKGAVGFVVGMALRKPGQYLTVRFQQSPSVCCITELGWQTDLALAM
ncbi:MAG: hypothetical protein HKN56_03985 [Gammaproteobacteria bacterium]|nr:hypothetical protein [Gammaproteobacteria bacterium]NND54114.1 hypothetical protein [Gammaproteobacteria bacterium]